MDSTVDPSPTSTLLLQAGVALATQREGNGIDHVSIRELADAIDVAPSTARRTYPYKDELARDTGLVLVERTPGGVPSDTVDTLVELLGRGQTQSVFPPEVLEAAIGSVTEMGMKPWMSALRFSHLDPVRRRLSARQRGTLHEITNLIRVVSASNQLDLDDLAATIALTLHTFGRGVALRQYVPGAEVDVGAISQLVSDLLDRRLPLTPLPIQPPEFEDENLSPAARALAQVAADRCETVGTSGPLDHLLLGDIAEQAHTTPTALYHWWSSVEEYRDALFAHMVERSLDSLPTTGTDRSDVAEQIIAVHGPVPGHRLAWRLVTGCIADRRPELHQMRARFHLQRDERIAAAVASASGVENSTQTKIIATAIGCFLDGSGAIAEIEGLWGDERLRTESVAMVLRVLEEL